VSPEMTSERSNIDSRGPAMLAPPPRLTMALAGLAAAGTATFGFVLFGEQPERAWQAYLVNLVFWTGLAAGSVLFSAILSITHARWGRPLKRLAEAPGAFLPVALVLFLLLYPGRERLFPWIAHPVAIKAAWLNVPFLFLRGGIGLLLLSAAAGMLIYLSVRRETGRPARLSDITPPRTTATGRPREEKPAVVWANIYAVLYALIMSLLAFDLIMSLSPHWHSTLFGAYYFVGSFYTALAAVMLLACLTNSRPGAARFIKTEQFHKLGMLILGFALMTGDFFYTQFLVIWYGNLPEETEFVILRTRFLPWQPLAWTVLAVCFILPFVTLLSRGLKKRPPAMLAVSIVILCGMWLERFLLVAPSLWPGPALPLGLVEAAITAGFLGIMGLCIVLFLGRFPMIPLADPLLRFDSDPADNQGGGK